MVHIGLDEKTRTSVAHILNAILANEFVLYVKTLKFHWNVVGSDFAALHEFFKNQYEQLLTISDDVAERARAMGYMAFGTCKEFCEHATISENPGVNPKASEMLAILCKDHEEIIRQLRAAVVKTAKLDDAGTNNFLIDLMEQHEKMAWMVRSFAGK